jgi:hypothetical protein
MSEFRTVEGRFDIDLSVSGPAGELIEQVGLDVFLENAISSYMRDMDAGYMLVIGECFGE